MLGLERGQGINHKEKRDLPAKTADEWLKREGLITWPVPIASEGELDLSEIEERLESREGLLKDLQNHASFDINVLDEFLQTVNGLEEFVSKFANQVLEINHENETANNLQPSAEAANEKASDYRSSLQWQKKKSDASTVSRKRTVENAIFPGFRSKELTPLPGSLEAPQLLNKVTNIQHFSGSFKKLWKQYFLSEATVAIFQDTFWWWFLYKFQPNSKGQAYLFNRLADSFVGLFLSISIQEKDFFFQKFADCLAQAVYAAFCESFPMSFKLFDDEFRSDLLNTLSEWVTGIRPPPNSWRSWNLDLLESVQIKSMQEDRTQQLRSSLSFNQDTFLDLDAPQQNFEKQITFNTSQTKMNKTAKESHQAGPGPQFQKVTFNLHGKSPLIAHFLSANRLQVEEPAAVKKLITRTEVDKYPPPFHTYQDLIQERRKEAKLAKKTFIESMGMYATQSNQKTVSPNPGDSKRSQRGEDRSKSASRGNSSLNGKINEMTLTNEYENEADGRRAKKLDDDTGE